MAERTNVPEIRFAGFTDPWEQRKFSDLTDRVSIQSNDPNLPQVEYEDIISGEGALNKDLNDKEGGKTGIKFYVGDVLYGKLRPYLMNWLYPQFNGVAVGDFWVLRATECDSSFLYRLVQTDGFQRLANVSSGSKMPRADWNLISQSFFAVPANHAEQKAIAKSLAELDSLITLHQRKYDKLAQLKKSMLDKMFPKPGERFPEIRFAGFTDPWEQRKLGNCGTTYGGLSGKTKEDFGHGNARFVPYTNVFDNPLTDTKRLETVEIDSSQNKVAYGDTFFTVSSETPDEVGMSSVWLSDQDDVYLNSFCFGYRQDSTFDPHYLAYMLRSSSIRSDLTLLAQGISRFNISKNKVMELSVPVPSAAEQKQIGQYFARLDSLITLHQRKLELLRNTKKSLLDRMFV
jgi:type I restriction enzyme S subunit